MTKRNIVFMDCETTGLHPVLDEVWSDAMIAYGPTGERADAQWFINVTDEALARLDSIPPEFREIYDREFDENLAFSPEEFVAEFREFRKTMGLNRPHMVGAVPSFDDRRVGDLLIGDGGRPWHYHLVCVENLIAGKLGLQPPWSSDELSRLVGVDPDGFDRHTAYGDVLWAQALYDAVMGLE